MSKIFADLGLEELSGDYTDTTLDGFGDSFIVVYTLAVLLAEMKENGSVDLTKFGASEASPLQIHVEPKENTQIGTALKYFALSPEDHSVSGEFTEDKLADFADSAEELRLSLE